MLNLLFLILGAKIHDLKNCLPCPPPWSPHRWRGRAPSRHVALLAGLSWRACPPTHPRSRRSLTSPMWRSHLQHLCDNLLNCNKSVSHPTGFAYIKFADKDSVSTAVALAEPDRSRWIPTYENVVHFISLCDNAYGTALDSMKRTG